VANYTIGQLSHAKGLVSAAQVGKLRHSESALMPQAERVSAAY
jgi:hypothetical protein